MITIWILIFIVSLATLIFASDVFTNRSERLALAFGISPFAIGITLVALGTSIPELATGIVSNFRGEDTIAIANTIGSNIANILLVLGISAVVVKKLKAERNLIDIDLPLLFLSTVLMLLVILDRVVTFSEAVLLIVAYNVYLLYAYNSGKQTREVKDVKESMVEEKKDKDKIDLVSVLLILVSIAVIYASADYTVRALIELATIFSIPTSAIAITAIAIGTSLPELVISLRAAMKGKHDLAIGNIMGSSIFNVLVIVGVPALFAPLVVDDLMWKVGVPFLIVATLTFIFSGITRRVYRWEGAMYLVVYALFLLQIFTFTS